MIKLLTMVRYNPANFIGGAIGLLIFLFFGSFVGALLGAIILCFNAFALKESYDRHYPKH